MKLVEGREDFSSFYKTVYAQDNPVTSSGGWIQWKGTDACIDLHCTCGNDFHMDAEFLYYIRCPRCKKIFALGQDIKLIELTEDQLIYLEEDQIKELQN